MMWNLQYKYWEMFTNKYLQIDYHRGTQVIWGLLLFSAPP